MGLSQKSGKESREEREKKLLLKHKYENRITVTKFGKENLDNGDYTLAIQRFTEYLNTMAEIKKAKDMFSLKPAHFNPNKDLTEMLMISHLFFEMARVYDAVPKFADESKKCLDQFVAFSANQPYQVVNSELIRKHLKKSVFKNPQNFRAAYEQIFVQSKNCFVVTFCYGTHHPMTNRYRDFKDWMLDYPLGRELVRLYYYYASDWVPRLEKNIFAHLSARFIAKPLLVLFSKTLLRLILK